MPGPFNPAAHLPPEVVEKILNLEFVEMAELTIDEESISADVPPTPTPIADIS